MEDLLKISNQLCFPIYALSKEITNQYRPLLEKLDLTYPQYLVLMVLWEHQKLNVCEIGKILRLDSGTLTPLLKRLEAKQIVKRERSKQDERIVDVSLTEKGIALEEDAVCIPVQLMEKVQLSPEEILQFKTIINKIFNTIEK
ncbi:MarR family transcriptional regulator [Paenimyroides tangerinum]|uniref:HTH-type transcriptional regulator SarZ n=1 Tax=Paenimyroides tangerinum TaxID=2488728 RepID=A0A3P3WEI2_9FLAO|nr:MarR family transcriptional regulator [Paenimyroides tangerinum]RRJ92808.1 MarR family transcriptional regulator [Paenimyroides tangerinum]